MEIAALITWVLTAGGGFYLLGTWLARGGMRQQESGTTRFPPALIFGHFLLAAIGLVLWIAYVLTDTTGLAWAAFVVLLPVALLGFTMFARWLGGRRGPAATAVADSAESAASVPAERHFPVAAVIGHGLLAATTLVLVLLAALAAGD
jgi:hypothetical protein